MAESGPSKEEAIRALKIMDDLNKLARKYPVLEVLAVWSNSGPTTSTARWNGCDSSTAHLQVTGVEVQVSDTPAQQADDVRDRQLRRALGHARGALMATAEALKAGRSEHLSIEALEERARECDEARALLIDGSPALTEDGQ